MKRRKQLIKLNDKATYQDESILRLSELTPAGTKIILEPEVELIELIKLTFFDLVLKQVLTIKKVQKKAHPRDPYIRKYVLVERGPNFEKYKPNSFEQYFTNKVAENKSYQLKGYVQKLYAELTSVNAYKIELINELRMNDLFKNSFINRILGLISTSSKGEQLKHDLNLYFNYVERNLAALIDNDPDKALQLLMFLQGNVILVKGLKFDLLEKLKQLSTKNISKENMVFDNWMWVEMIGDVLSLPELIVDISELFHSIEDKIDFDFGSISDGSFDFDFDIDIDF